MGEFNRMAQRHLQDGGAELDPLSRNAKCAKRYERIQSGPASAQRVGHPDTRKTAFFYLPSVVDDASECAPAGFGVRPHKCHYTQSHDRSPTENVAVTPPLLVSPKDNAIDPSLRPTAD